MSGPKGADLIAAERQRQIEQEDWTPEHDRAHGPTPLSRAAYCYATASASPDMGARQGWWPWEEHWWKPKGPLRNLVRAGALYQAALEVADPEQTATTSSPRALAEARDCCAAAIDALLAEMAAVTGKDRSPS